MMGTFVVYASSLLVLRFIYILKQSIDFLKRMVLWNRQTMKKGVRQNSLIIHINRAFELQFGGGD